MRSKKVHKHKLLLDENFPLRSYFPNLNKRFDLKHISGDYKQAGLPDPKVYDVAKKENRLVVTFNTRDFVDLAQTSAEAGVIGISQNLPMEQIDKKISSLLLKSTKKSLMGKLTIISGESEID